MNLKNNEISIEEAVSEFEQVIGSPHGVLNIRSGLQLVNGQYTNQHAVIVSVDYAAEGSEETIANLPSSIKGFSVQVRAATPADFARQRGGLSVERVPRIRYRPPERPSLDPVDEEMFAVFHVSPDAGWTQLQEFLSRTKASLTIGLYNFGAHHIKAALEKVIARENKTLCLVLGDASIDKSVTDKFEAQLVKKFACLMGGRFRYELADGNRRLFAGHYHIKVAVRDSKAVWLSSGNWETSNQPNVDPVGTNETSWKLLREKNREWHAIVLNQQLSETFERYIKYDLNSYRKIRTESIQFSPSWRAPLFLVPKVSVVESQPVGKAKYFAPLCVHKRLRIQPLLTPDNFMDHVIELVDTAKETIDLQNQTLKWRDSNIDARFEELMDTILRKHKAGVQVRIILRSDYSPEMKEMLVRKGFKANQIKLQSKCHTKGIIVDSRRVLLGSHNLSEAGALANRDASLIVDDDEVAKYFKSVFQFDWDRASRLAHETPKGISIYRFGDEIPDGYELVSIPDMSL